MFLAGSCVSAGNTDCVSPSTAASGDDNDSMTRSIYHLRLPPDQIGDGQRTLRFREELLSEAREAWRAGEDGRGLWTWLGPSR